ncbi:MAG: DUF362 domain-containing protein [archaeon]
MKVVIQKCESYEDAERAVEEGLEKLGGIEAFIKKGDKVLIKPNLLGARKPEDCVTTHPEVVRAVIRQIKKITDEITIGDSPGFVGNVRGWETVIEKTGMKKIAEEENVKLEALKTPKEVESKEWIITKKLMIAEETMKYDKIVNVAKLKTHSLTVYTGCVKNMFGIIPGRLKSGMHTKFQDPYNFSKMLLDLYMVRKPDLNIIDGVYGMEGDGPASGDVRHFGIIGLSQDALELDYAITKDTKLEIPMIRIAEERKMIMKVEVEGEFKTEIKKPSTGILTSYVLPIAGNVRNKLTSKPALTQERCTKCESCYKICPVKAISMNPYPEFDYSKCIRCYCCHEICPEKAIYLKKSIVQKLLRR